MKHQLKLTAAVVLLFTLEAITPTLCAQGTAFTYQGQLSSGGTPANGSYDLQFTLFATNAGGTALAGPVTNAAVAVANGGFSTAVDFGGGVFTGGSNWLQVAVSTSGANAFVMLSPRQQLTPTPYAITAAGLSGVVGYQNLPGFQNGNSYNSLGGGNGNIFSGTYGYNTIAGGQNNEAGVEYSTVGGGYGNAASGYLSTVTGGANDAATGQYSFVGGGLENKAYADYSTAVGGYYNTVFGAGAFIGGGGTDGTHFPGNTANGPGSVIAGGVGNYSAASAQDGFIGGGFANTNGASFATVSGGQQNTASGQWSTVGGGTANTASGDYATVPGGTLNTASGYASLAAGSFAQATNFGSFVWADGQLAPFTSTTNNQFNVRASGGVRLVTGGTGLSVDGQPALLNGTSISIQQNAGSGPNVVIAPALNSVSNGITGATISGGSANLAVATDTTIGGGENNTASAVNATIGGGGNNTASGSGATVGGGLGNNASHFTSTIGGGYLNTASADYATVPGGHLNLANGTNSFAAGQQAQALHPGAFVWADSQNAAFASTTNDQFNVRAQGGARFVTSGSGLIVDGAVTANAFVGNGGGLTNVSLAALSGGSITSDPGQLAMASSPGTGLNPDAVVAADVNGDGKIDLVSANYGDHTLTVLTNNGLGTFTVSSTWNAGYNPYYADPGSQPIALRTADVNGDGKVDLICLNNYGTNNLKVYTNNGTGSFALASALTVSNVVNYYSGNTIFATADVNGDGKVDLIIASPSGYTLRILTNNGSGTFVPAPPVTGFEAPNSVAAVDVNGDGKVDLVAVNFGLNTLTVVTNNGSGGFALAAIVNVNLTNTDADVYSVVAADVNGDGRMDLIGVSANGNTLTVLTNNGSGGFAQTATLNVGNLPNSVVTTDVNGDGKLDLVTANGGDNTLTVLTNDGTGGFVLAATLVAASGPCSIGAADVNGDGRMDVVCADSGASELSVFLNAWSFAGAFSGAFAGTFAGNGSALTTLNTTNLTGTFPAANLSGVLLQTNLGAEGSFTPSIGDGSNNFVLNPTQSSGYYVKIGSLVYVEMSMNWTNLGSTMTNASVSIGLPFPAVSGSAVLNVGSAAGFFQDEPHLDSVAMAAVTYGTGAQLNRIGNGEFFTGECAPNGYIVVSGFYRWR